MRRRRARRRTDMTAAEGRAQKRHMQREIARGERVKAREQMIALQREVCETGSARAKLRARCAAAIARARARVEAARARLREERTHRRTMRVILAGQRAQRRHERVATRRERVQESDYEVETNLDPELVPLWRRVKSRIRGTGRMTRTEVFLHYVHEHPGEVWSALEAESEAKLERMFAERASRHRLRRSSRSRRRRGRR